jgi:YebC/PmpR family DNA-binding regulatory protein
MSGHSKWATIKRAKGANDVRRGAAFTKLANAITIAVREGGGVTDPDFNFKLRLAMEKAKEANMPKENIARSIDRGAGKGDGAQLTTALYEGFAPGGVAVMVETISDNNARTAAELRNIFNKLGGNLGSPGSVAYLFARVGEIEGVTFEQAVEVGALDFDDGTLYTKPEDLHKVSAALEKPGSLVFRPNKQTMVTVSDPEQLQQLETLLEAIDDLDDIQNIYTNHV